jgi:hypothetical protein
MSSPCAAVLEDVQNTADHREVPINKVGIKDVRHPAVVKDRSGGEQRTIASFSLYASLPQHFKGTHTSRSLEMLDEQENEITVRSFHEMLFEISDRLEAETSHVEMRFPCFVEKTAPFSGVKSLMDYDIAFLGRKDGDGLQVYLKVAGRRHQPLPLLQRHLRVRRPQPALADHGHRAHSVLHPDRGTDRSDRGRRVLRPILRAQTPRREIRH